MRSPRSDCLSPCLRTTSLTIVRLPSTLSAIARSSTRLVRASLTNAVTALTPLRVMSPKSFICARRSSAKQRNSLDKTPKPSAAGPARFAKNIAFIAIRLILDARNETPLISLQRKRYCAIADRRHRFPGISSLFSPVPRAHIGIHRKLYERSIMRQFAGRTAAGQSVVSGTVTTSPLQLAETQRDTVRAHRPAVAPAHGSSPVQWA